MDVKILVADELISMLDASTRMGILNLLVDICRDTGMSVLFITHDLALGYYVSDYTMINASGPVGGTGAPRLRFTTTRFIPTPRCCSAPCPISGGRWDPREKFIPEQVTMEIDEFYAENRGRGWSASVPNTWCS